MKMKPFYHDEWVTIHHMDYREGLSEITAVDLVLTDPPYNVGIDYGDYKDSLKFPEYREEIGKFINKARALSGNRIVLVLGSKVLKCWWDFLPEAKLIIVRMGAVSNNKMKNLSLQFHPVLTTVPSNTYLPDLWEDIRWPGEGYFFNEPRFGHPAMTPEKLARRLVAIFSEPGQTILDPFLGVGTMAIASKVLNRYCIGFEIERKYCEIAANRCRQMVMELEV